MALENERARHSPSTDKQRGAAHSPSADKHGGKHHHETFRKLASRVSHSIGTPIAFVIAALAVVTWAASGPIFGFSDTWQLVINTSTTIITFLVVFLIQNTQNHDAKAIHLKLDELIWAIKKARTEMVDLETLPDEELDRLEAEFHRLRLREANAEQRFDVDAELESHEARAERRHSRSHDPAREPFAQPRRRARGTGHGAGSEAGIASNQGDSPQSESDQVAGRPGRGPNARRRPRKSPIQRRGPVR